jgi:addiction module HigA family antidote
MIEVGSMTKKLPKRGLPPMHPGQLLREEILPALNRPKTQIAKLLGVSRQTLYDLLEENQPVTPIMALRLGKLCGNGPDLWLNLQRRYDLQRASQQLGAKINAIPTLDVA